MARFIELEDINGRKVSINIDFIQTIKNVTNDNTWGNTCILLNNDIVQTNLEYSKVIENLSNRKRKDSAYGSN